MADVPGTDTPDETVTLLVDAALPHVAFDGWSPKTFRNAVSDSGVAPGLADAAAPRGALDLAIAFHKLGDARMAATVTATETDGLRYRDRVAAAVRARIEAAEDREAVRRATTLLALPQHAALGARLLWDTSDAIWLALGDTSRDINWYTKRATLSGVYAATVLYWLGDDSPEFRDTWEFLDRRIEDVMSIEKARARIREAPGLRQATAFKDRLASRFGTPGRQSDLSGV